MSWFSDFMHPGRGYDDAATEYRNALNTATGYQAPFQKAGVDAISGLQKGLSDLMNPVDLQKRWVDSYQESPYAQQLQKEAQQQGMDSASAQGLLGSSAAVGGIQQRASNIMQQDRQQYLDDLMKKYMGGVEGLQGMFGTGAQVGGQMGQETVQTGRDLGEAAFGRRQSGANMFGGLLNAGLGMGMDYLTGGMGKGSWGRGAWS
jgi:hypothetical protein